jgi:hypothetical protein
VKIKRWDNEVNASIRLKHDTIPGNITYSDDGEKITWIKKQGQNEWKAIFYHRDDLDEGGFEFEVHLPANPPVNFLEFTVNTKELDWFYQPALTQQEIDEGLQRPENVVGSYAVYHKTKGGMNDAAVMEYKVGKAFHVYRPHVVDANGNEAWGTLSLNEQTGILTISVDQTWLDNAAYPVKVDPTFGYTSGGASEYQIAVKSGATLFSERLGNDYLISTNGTLTKIDAFLNANESHTTDVFVSVNQKDGSGANSHTQIATGETLDLALTTTSGWFSFSISGSITSGVTYLVTILGNGADMVDASDDTTIKYDATGNRSEYEESATGAGSYATLKESPWTETPATANRQLSIYATYTTTTAGTYTDTYGVGTHTWTAPTGVTSAVVKAWGGGGKGYYASGDGGAGGGGGAYAASTVAVTPSTGYTVTVGAGGITGAVDGGDSQFVGDDKTVLADGGTGATSRTANGLGGTLANSTGDTEYIGGNGSDGVTADYGGGGGGAGGPDGAGGAPAVLATSSRGANGGDGDNGSGGAGGTGGTDGVAGTVGASNALGGGGGGGGGNGNAGAAGGYPGGGGGGGETGSGNGAGGKVSITYTIPVSAGTQTTTFALNAPTVTAESGVVNKTVTPNEIPSTLTLQAPTVSAIKNATIATTGQAVTLTQQTPTVTATKSATLTPSQQTTTLALQEPTITTIRNVSLTPDAVTATVSTQAPTIVAESGAVDKTVSAGLQTATLALQDITVTAIKNISLSQTQQTSTISPQAPTVSTTRNISIDPSYQSAVIALQGPTVSAVKNTTQTPNQQSATLALQDPTITATKNITLTPDLQTTNLSLQAPTVTAIKNVAVVPDVVSLTPSLQAPTISTVVPWYNESWLYRVKVTVLASKVDADLTDFPVYVNLADLPAGFHTNVNQTDGRDIRVTTSDMMTEVPREVVFYNSATDTGELHFKGSVYDSTDTDYYIYYGNASATEPAADATYGKNNVWTDNYAGIYHLAEASGNLTDSTSNAKTMTASGTATYAQDGTLGKSIYFSGDDDFYRNASPAAIFTSLPTQMTFSTWIKADDFNSLKVIVIHGDDGDAYIGINTSGTINWNVNQVTTGWKTHSNSGYSTGTWYYVCGAWTKNSYIRLYVNGSPIASPVSAAGDYALADLGTNYPATIGGYRDPASQYRFVGYIDEVRYSYEEKSATWISTEYNNQSSPSTFYQVGTHQSNGVTDSTQTPAQQTTTITLQNPTVTAIKNSTQTPAQQTTTISLQAPTITAVKNVTPTADQQATNLSLQAPTITAIKNVTQTPDVVSSTFQLLSPSVFAGGAVTYQPSTLSETLTLQEPTLVAQKNISISADLLTTNLSQLTPDVVTTKNITYSADAVSATFGIQEPSIIQGTGTSIACNTQSLTFNLMTPTVTAVHPIDVTVYPQTIAMGGGRGKKLIYVDGNMAMRLGSFIHMGI